MHFHKYLQRFGSPEPCLMIRGTKHNAIRGRSLHTDASRQYHDKHTCLRMCYFDSNGGVNILSVSVLFTHGGFDHTYWIFDRTYWVFGRTYWVFGHGSLVPPTGSLVEPTQRPSSSNQPLTSSNEHSRKRSTSRKPFT